MGSLGSKETPYVLAESLAPQPITSKFSTLTTGDLVRFVEKPTDGKKPSWNHVGIVFHLPQLYPGYGPLLLEGGREFNDELLDVITQTIKKTGVRLVRLHDRISLNKDAEAIRLLSPHQNTSSLSNETELITIISKVASDNIFQLFGNLSQPNVGSMYHVSGPSIIAYCLNEFDLLSRSTKLANFTTKNVTNEKKLSKLLLDGYSYVI